MTKFKLNSDSSSGSQVTLTSYMVGAVDGGLANHGYESSNDLTKEGNMCRGCLKKNNNNAIFLIPDESYLRKRAKPTVKERLEDTVKKGCTRKVLYKRVPILSWLPSYNLDNALCDFVAGVTVGLTVIPQAIAYANVAGLPPQIGLYSAFMGCFFYAIFGSVKDSPIGPTAIAALLTRENIHGLGPAGATILCFLNGCVVLLMGVFQCGFLIDFVSGPVSVGFTSAAAIIIATTQMKDILGLPYPGGDFVIVWEQIFQHISETSYTDAALGVGTILVLLLLRSIKNVRFGSEDNEGEPLKAYLNKSIWLISTARNIIVVCVTAALAYFFEMHGSQPFRLTGYIRPGLPDVQPPQFEITTGNTTRSFIEVTSTIGSGLIVVPLLCILENIALAKVFAEGKAIDATQEMFALGICNIASSFVQSMPLSGALSRGAVNNASGVRTTFGGIYTAIIVMFSLKFLTPWFSYIPKASLAGVIVAAVIFMVEIQVVKPMWRTKRYFKIRTILGDTTDFVTRNLNRPSGVITQLTASAASEAGRTARLEERNSRNLDFEKEEGAPIYGFGITVQKTDLIPATATFLGCLVLRLEIGIILGIAINIIFLLYQSARPSVRVEKLTTTSGCDYLLITPDRSLSFPSVEYVRSTVSKAGIKQGSSSIPVVVDAKHIQAADFTAAKGIKSLIDDFHKRNQAIIFFNLKPRVSIIFQGVGPKDFIHCSTYQELNQLLHQHCKDTKCKIKLNDTQISLNM